jgi:hypothetical protein
MCLIRHMKYVLPRCAGGEMRISRHFLEEQDMTLIRVRGELDDNKLMRYAVALNRIVEKSGAVRHIVDFREVSCLKRLSVLGVTEYAKREPDQPEGSLALLISDSSFHFGMARAYQTFALEKRMAVEIFQERDAAVAWCGRGG